LCANAARLSAAEYAGIWRLDSELLWNAGHYPDDESMARFVGHVADRPIALTRGSANGRAALERRTVHIGDLRADPEYDWHEAAAIGGFQAALSVPLLRKGTLLGVLALARTEARAFSAREIELVESFADQAVIAIENARLFSELQERLEEQTATA